MSRTIVIGNSHTGALKSAWDEVKTDYPGEEVIFYAAPGPTFQKLRLGRDLVFGPPARADAVVRKTVEHINGRLEIDLKSGDAVVSVGHQGRFHTIAKLLADFDIDGLREVGSPCRMSRAAFEAMIKELAAGTLPGPEWRNWSAPSLSIALKPMPSATLIDNQPKSHWAVLAERPMGVREAFARYFECLSGMCSDVGIALVTPPEAALLPCGLTMAEFSRDSRRLRHDETHPDNDSTHMNSRYGALWFEHFFATRRDRLGTEPVALCS